MQVVRKDADALNITIELTLEPSDYSAKFESEIKKHKTQSQIKGFRKGMTPASVIKKMYGKSILSDIINDSLQEKLFAYLDENKINYLGQPLPNRDENFVFNLDVNNLQEYKFSFDLGLAPTLEISGVSSSDKYDCFDISVPNDTVDEEFTTMRRRNGKRVEVSNDIQNMDMLKLDAEELDGNTIKDGGWKTSFTVLVDIIHDQDVKKEILTKKLGDSINFDIYKLEDKDAAHIDKYLLKRPEDIEVGNMFTAKISEVSRIELAEMDEAFFQSFGDESVTDEASAKALIAKDIKSYYDNQALQFMYRAIMDALLEKNQVDLPEQFLRKYLKETNENVSDEVLNDEFDAFVKNLRWSLIKSQLAKEYSIEVGEEDLKKHFLNSVMSYFRNYGNMDYSMISQTVDRLMKDKEQVNKAYEEILADKLFLRIGEIVQKNKIEIGLNEFTEKVKELNAKINNF